jgi:hypothetical protein
MGRRYRWGTWGLVALLGISALLNVASQSAWENYLLAPMAVVLAVLCGVVAYKASAAHGHETRRTARDPRSLAG